jgi:NADH:ubiquinone oxidoreductase subunit 6 (subunit J)
VTTLLSTLSILVALTGAITAVTKSFRVNILALWVSGIGLGLIFLVLGSEILAIAQWFFSTTTTLLILTYSLIMGDWLSPESEKSQWQEWILPILGASSFAGIIAIGLHDFEQWTLEISFEPVSVVQYGAQLLSHHPLVLLVLGFEILLTLVGIGVVGRPDWRDQSMGEA